MEESGTLSGSWSSPLVDCLATLVNLLEDFGKRTEYQIKERLRSGSLRRLQNRWCVSLEKTEVSTETSSKVDLFSSKHFLCSNSESTGHGPPSFTGDEIKGRDYGSDRSPPPPTTDQWVNVNIK